MVGEQVGRTLEGGGDGAEERDNGDDDGQKLRSRVDWYIFR